MTAIRIIAAFCAALAFAAADAHADSRIRTRTYAENAVYSLTGHFGFQTIIEFNDDEIIENVAIGDSVSWQVTPNRRGDVIILKPIAAAPPTNMTVVTSLRHYFFELSAKSAADAKPGEMIYVLRFSYPGEKQAAQAAVAENAAFVPEKIETPEDRATNREYSYAGSREIVPSLVFDDGSATYFRWPEGAPTPAVFLISGDDKESVINHGYEAGFIVVDRVAPEFSLKHGEFETRIYNDAFTPIDPGPDAPQMRPKKRGFFGKVFGGDEENG
jgi:type IV secretion system protein VirB9